MKTNIANILLFATLLMLLPSLAFARSNRVGQMPNNEWGCDICHTANGGLTDFGFDSYDYTENGNVNWAQLAGVDSDRDGYSNGLELGDPNGTWRTGDADPNGPTTDPNDVTSNFCGDGVFQENEECDGANMNGESCSSLGVGTGTLSCNPNTCQFDTTSCGAAECGDGMRSQTEDCEAGDLGGATCEMLGYDGGVLTCSRSCTFDTLSCTGQPGNNDPGFSRCGDTVQTGAEECDGFDLGGASCTSIGYTGGNLSCTSSCTFNVSQCEGPAPGSQPAEEPADRLSDTAGQALSSGDAVDFEAIEMQGRACAVGGSGNLTPVALLLGLVGLFRRRR